MVRTACIGTCIAAGMALCSCGFVPVGGSSSTEESYYLLGRRELAGTGGDALTAEQQDMASSLVTGRALDSGLYYRVTYRRDGSLLKSGPVTFRTVPGGGLRGDYPSAPAYDPDGELSVTGDECTLTLTLRDPPEVYEEIHLTGTFDREEAQLAIFRARKTDKMSNYVESAESFTVEWQISGQRNGEPLSLHFTQVFVAARVRYSTPI